jgi:hypothetical protein
MGGGRDGLSRSAAVIEADTRSRWAGRRHKMLLSFGRFYFQANGPISWLKYAATWIKQLYVGALANLTEVT